MNSLTSTSDLIQSAASELEALRCVPIHDGEQFPSACRSLLYNIPGNSNCVDCGSARPTWASVTYGVLLCVQCSGRHRSYGVNVSRVRSIDMDAWSHTQVLAMLEGGNQQLQQFFDRHNMGNKTSMVSSRYMTKAALFYRSNLTRHVERVSGRGQYEGRDAVRRRHKKVQNNNSNNDTVVDQSTLPRRQSIAAH